MLRFLANADDLLHSRFAISPMFEVQSLLRHLIGLGRRRLPWAARLEPALARLRRDAELDVVLSLLSASYGPGFVVPPPRGLAQTIEDDLAAVRSTPLNVVRAEIAEALGRRPVSDPRILARLRRDDVTERVAEILSTAWHELVAPDWPLLRAVCERDVLFRSGELVRAGWAAALARLHPQVRWRGDGIEISNVVSRESIALGGAGILFVPSVFAWPRVAVYTADPWPKAIVYPARGTASLWETHGTQPEALSDLIGRSRTRLLLALAQPASTTHLASITRLAIGSVNDHLRVLLRAGLLTSSRAGRSVLYRRTPLGDVLAGMEVDD